MGKRVSAVLFILGRRCACAVHVYMCVCGCGWVLSGNRCVCVCLYRSLDSHLVEVFVPAIGVLVLKVVSHQKHDVLRPFGGVPSSKIGVPLGCLYYKINIPKRQQSQPRMFEKNNSIPGRMRCHRTRQRCVNKAEMCKQGIYVQTSTKLAENDTREVAFI